MIEATGNALMMQHGNHVSHPTLFARVKRALGYALVGAVAGPLLILFIPFALASGFESLPIPNRQLIAVIVVFTLIVIIVIVCYLLFAYIYFVLIIGSILGSVGGAAYGAWTAAAVNGRS